MTYSPPVARRGFWELWLQQQRSHSPVTEATRYVQGQVVDVTRWVNGRVEA